MPVPLATSVKLSLPTVVLIVLLSITSPSISARLRYALFQRSGVPPP